MALSKTLLAATCALSFFACLDFGVPPEGDPGAGEGADGGTQGGSGAPVAVPTSCSDYSNSQPAVSQSAPLQTVYRFARDLNATPTAPFGYGPEDALVEGPDGNLYGVSRYGGTSDNGYDGRGVVFRVSPGGEVAALHTFDFRNTGAIEGEEPVGKLIVGPDCALYGTTSGGWKASSTMFRITLAGELNYVAGFDVTTGVDLYDRLTLGSDGNFYGMAMHGGAHHNEVASYLTGTVFKVSPAGAVTVLVSFNGVNGGEPRGGLVEGSDGFFYGVTSKGGAHGEGTIFKIAADGQFQNLYSFEKWTGQGDDSGHGVTGALVEGPDGAFYGSTQYGGAHGGGTIFRISSSGAYQTLHHFNPVTVELGCNCGMAKPYGPLLLASDGNFYGLVWGGSSASGTGEGGAVFRMTPQGTVSPAVFLPSGGPRQAMGGLIESSDGFLYGTAMGGSNDYGQVYSVRLAP